MKGRLIEAIKLAQEQGHIIEFYKRKDGGYRITSVDGKKYKGSEGNQAVRKITGKGALSGKQKIALSKGRAKISKGKLSKKESKKFAKINKVRKKVGLSPIKKIKARKVKKSKSGKKKLDDMMDRMTNAIKKKLGFANEGNITSLIAQLTLESTTPNEIGAIYDFSAVIDYLKANSKYIMDTSVLYCIATLYDYQHGYIDGRTAETLMLDELRASVERMKDVLKELKELMK